MIIKLSGLIAKLSSSNSNIEILAVSCFWPSNWQLTSIKNELLIGLHSHLISSHFQQGSYESSENFLLNEYLMSLCESSISFTTQQSISLKNPKTDSGTGSLSSKSSIQKLVFLIVLKYLTPSSIRRRLINLI